MKREENKRERGSITIEASISLTFFLFAMLCLLFAIRVSRVQAAVQYSLDMAALDISQYTYLYYASGLYDLEQDIKQSGEEAGKTLTDGVQRLDQSALGVETILSTLENNGKSAVGDLNEGDIEGAVGTFRETAQKLKEEGKNIAEQADGLKELAKQIKDDPISFAKSMAALATGEGLDVLKGPLLGMVFGRAMCEKYIGNGQDADAWLRRMKVIEGLDGLNFGWSSVLGGTSQDVNLVVTYKVQVFPGVLDGIEATFAQSASTRAWLGGDARIEKDFTPLESKAPAESPAPSPKPSLWEMDNAQKGAAMKELLRREYEGVGFVSGDTGIYGYSSQNNIFYNCTAMDVFSDSYQQDSAVKGRIKQAAQNTAEKALAMTEVSTDDGTAHTVDGTRPVTVELLVVIPENVTQERKEAVQAQAVEAAKALNQSYEEDGGRQVSVSIRVVTGGGDSPKGEGQGETGK